MHFTTTTTTTTVLLLAPFLVPTATAWFLTVYDTSTPNCNSDPNFSGSYAAYSGSSSSNCFEAGTGDSTAQCSWFTDGGVTGPSQCTGPMIPSAGSWSVSQGSSCAYWANQAGLGGAGCSGDGSSSGDNNAGNEGICDGAGSKSIPQGDNWYFKCSDA